MCTTPGENTCHSSWLGFSSIDWPVTEDVDNALEEAFVSLDDELEPCPVELWDDSFDSTTESPFAAAAFVAKSEPPLADDEFVTETLKAEVFIVTTDMLEFVVTAMVVIAELVVMSRPEVVEFSVLALKALSLVVVDNNSVAAFVLVEVEERLAAPLDELEELEAETFDKESTTTASDASEVVVTAAINIVVEETVLVAVGVVVVGVDVGVVVVPVVTVVVVLVTVEAVIVVVIVVAVVVVGRFNTLFWHCSSVCVVLSFFKSSRWPVSMSMKPGSATRTSQSPDLWPQTTSLYGETLSLREYTELALRTFTPKGSMTCHSEIRPPSMVETARPIISLLCGPKTDESEPATHGSARASTPTVATDAATPRQPRHR